ncbi:MAG TPA: PaaI family thioesterase [Arenicellales bacterium]|nr:PaaI family thioesterase [Arenicellales bacterium]
MSETQTSFTARDPDFEQRVRDSFSRQRVMAFLGASLGEVEPGRATISLPYRPELSQQHGFFHGGIVGTIADSAAGYAGYTLMPADASVLTVEYKLNLMAPAAGKLLTAVGRVLRPGRNLVVTQADVFVAKEGGQRQCAVLLQTLMCMHQQPDTAADAA